MAEELAIGIVKAAEKLEKKEKLKQIVPLYEYTERIEYRTISNSGFELDTLRTTYKFGDEHNRYDNLSTVLSHINNQGYSTIACGGDDNNNDHHLEKKFLGLVGKETIERTSSKRHYTDIKIIALYEK